MRFRKLALWSAILGSAILVGCAGKAPVTSAPTSNATQPAPASAAPVSPVSSGPVELKIAHVTKTTDVFHLVALKFKETVEASSNGQIRVTILPEGQAGAEKDILVKTQAGDLDGAVVTGGSTTSIVPELGLFDLPWLFEGPEHVHSVLDGSVGEGFAGKLRQAGFAPLGILDFGFRHLTNSKRPVRTLEDAKGLKLRVLPNSIYSRTWDTITGVEPLTLNWPDVPKALASGQIDGQENPVSILTSYKMWETQKYASKTGHVFAVGMFLINSAKYNGLTPEQRSAVDAAAKAAIMESRRLVAEAEAKGWEELRRQGMTIVGDVDRPAFRARALDKVFEEHRRQIPGDWLSAVRSQAKA